MSTNQPDHSWRNRNCRLFKCLSPSDDKYILNGNYPFKEDCVEYIRNSNIDRKLKDFERMKLGMS